MKIHPPSRFSGATLVEVVVTVGIMVSTLLPLLGMLSIAMDTSGKASNNTLSARIAAEVVGELQQATWGDLSDIDGNTYYYDYQGVRLTGANAQTDSVYTARARVSAPGMVMASTVSPPSNPWQRQAMALVVAKPAAQAEAILTQAVSALSAKGPLPSQVMVHRTLLVNMQKAP